MKIFKYKFGPLSGLPRKKIYGGKTVPATQVREEALKAMKAIESICNVRFHTGGSKRILVRYRDNWYYRGWHSNKEIGLNSFTGTNENNKYGMQDQIYLLIAHELSHWLLGAKHSNEKNSIRHANVGKMFTPKDISLFQQKYGAPGEEYDEAIRKRMVEASKLLSKKYKKLSEQQNVIKQVIGMLQ